MTIQVELSPQAEAKLVGDASTHGLAPEAYAGKLLQEVLTADAQPKGKLTVETFHAMLDELAQGSDGLPTLATDTFTRGSFYEERA